MVTLKQTFFKSDRSKNKFVSIEQTLAEIHGLRKDMQVYIRKIPRAELKAFVEEATRAAPTKKQDDY